MNGLSRKFGEIVRDFSRFSNEKGSMDDKTELITACVGDGIGDAWADGVAQ